MLRTNRLLAGVAFSLLLGLAACDNEEVFRPGSVVTVDPMFERYVSIGNSITAGFQSGGIYDTIQAQAYPVLLARAMSTPAFYTPSMAAPGCPAPYTNVFTQTRRPGPACALRKSQPIPPPYINNVAVPGAEVMDAINNLDSASNANSLTMFFLGGLTQTQMMARVQPTFVSVWIGNNDVLGSVTAAASGDSTRITATAAFQTRYDQMLDSVENVGVQGAILIGVANVTAIPYLTPASTYWAIKNGLVPGAPALPALFTVSANCALISSGIPGARGDSTLVPFPYGGALLAAAGAGSPRNLDCGDTVVAVVVPAELRRLAAAVTAYNAFIAGEATARGFAYLNPNLALDSLKTIPTQVAPFPSFGAACTANPFGLAFSCDAVHPSASTHRLIANKLRQAINAFYSTTLPAIP